MKRFLTPIIVLILTILLCSANVFASPNTFSWYCRRNSEHKQPDIDSNMSFIESYSGYYVDRSSKDKKVIYLTFDAGYENGNISKILDTLKEEKVPAAFFILENLIKKDPELIIRMKNEGHLICNHTARHPDVTKFSCIEDFKKEVEALETLYYDLIGEEMPKYFRPPEGKFNEQSMRFASELGYKTIFWSFAYADWDNNSQPSHEYARSKILSNVHNGEIMLLHPTSSTNAEILKDIITELKAQGYSFGTLDDIK